MARKSPKDNNGLDGPQVGGVDAGRLRSFVQRIQQLETEITDLNSDKSEVYDEASADFDKKALKIVVRRLRKGRAEVDTEDFLVSQYERALGIGDRGEAPTVVQVDDLDEADSLPPAVSASRARARQRADA